jgi:hypothetical protein
MNTVTLAHITALLAISTWSDTKIGEKTTVVCLTLPNGFEVIESSGCVDPANYNHALGVEICKKRITDKVWMLEGYALAERMKSPVFHDTPGRRTGQPWPEPERGPTDSRGSIPM